MDQIDAILRLKNCYKELEEIDKDQVFRNLNAAKHKISEKISEMAEALDLSDFIPKITSDTCEICKEPIVSVWVGKGTGYVHLNCFDTPNVPKPKGPIKPHKIHRHAGRENKVNLDYNHVIIDREIFERLLEKWDQIEEYLTQTAVII